MSVKRTAGRSQVPQELRDEIPSFEKPGGAGARPDRLERADVVPGRALGGGDRRHSSGSSSAIFFLLQGVVIWTHTPAYVFPKPIDTVRTFVAGLHEHRDPLAEGDRDRVPRRARDRLDDRARARRAAHPEAVRGEDHRAVRPDHGHDADARVRPVPAPEDGVRALADHHRGGAGSGRW